METYPREGFVNLKTTGGELGTKKALMFSKYESSASANSGLSLS
jgi:hypothetical protein